MADYPVKWYSRAMAGAPSYVVDQPGSTIELLQALLVDGFNPREPDTLTYDAATGEGVLLFSAGSHGYVAHQIIEISGAEPAEYNGQWRVTPHRSLTEVRFPMGAAPSANGTGTIVVKTAPAGWTRPFVSADGLRAIFKPNNATTSDISFYIDNRNQADTTAWNQNGTSSAYMEVLMRGRAGVTDLDSYAEEFGAGWFHPGYHSTSSTSPTPGASQSFIALADDKTCYFGTRWRAGGVGQQWPVVVFGDIESIRRPRHRDALLSLFAKASTGGNYNGPTFGLYTTTIAAITTSYAYNAARRLPTGHTLEEKNANLVILSHNPSTAARKVAYPLNDGSLPMGGKYPLLTGLPDTDLRSFVGWLPGTRESFSLAPLPDQSVVAVDGRLYMLMNHEAGDASVMEASTFFDLDGPWQ